MYLIATGAAGKALAKQIAIILVRRLHDDITSSGQCEALAKLLRCTKVDF
jgi:hypothetical protein